MYRLIVRMTKDNIFRLLFLLLGTAVVTSICLLCFADLNNEFKAYQELRTIVPSDYIVVTFDGGACSSKDKDKIMELMGSVSELDDVVSTVPFGPQELYLQDDSWSVIRMLLYDQPITEDFAFDIVEGRVPVCGTNEVLITEDSTDNYSVGDIIHVQVIDWMIDDSSGDVIQLEKFYQETDIVIVGVISNESDIMLPVYYCGPESTPLEFFSTVTEQTEQLEWPLFISYGLSDDIGQPLQHDYEHCFSCSYIVIPTEREEHSNAEEKINYIISGYGSAKTCGELIEDAVDSKWDEYRPIIGVTISGVFMIAITLVSLYLFQIKRGMTALISYYICGVSWNRIILSLCLINVPVTLLGYIAGIVYFEVFTVNWDYMRLSPISLFVTLFFILCLQALISFMFYLSVHKVSPSSIRRIENE